MRKLAEVIAMVFVNALVFWGLNNYLDGFEVAGDWRQIAGVAVIFTLLNLILKPVLKLVLGPVIILTLGLGLILVNVLMLFILDRITNNLTILGILPLLYAAIVVGLSNFVVHIIFKK